MDHLQEVLDLAIVFTQPPPGLPPEILAHIAIQCDALGLRHGGDIFADPLTEAERNDLHWYLEEYWLWPYLEFAERGKRVEALLEEIGRRLYQALFGGREVQNIIQAWQQCGNVQHRISIISEIAGILRLPWELLADPQGFLVFLSDQPISLVRRLPTQVERVSLTAPFQPPLRILLITARPEDAGFVDPRGISHELVDELQRQSDAGTIELEFLRPPTFSALRARLKNTERPIHVLHFDGHGGLDQTAQQGVLLFETNAGKQSPVKASDVAKVLSTSDVRLAILTACQSATNIEDDAFSGVSTQLITNGMDAVVAMSSSILVTSAALYTEAFYRALAEGLPAPIAHEQARKALQKDSHRHFFRRRQDEEAAPVTLVDWWVPHFYQQQPLTLRAATTPRKHSLIPTNTPARFNEAMPQEPRYQFSGRARELLQIERALLHKCLVVLSGFGGIGKTALAREAADWFTRTGLYMSACFVSFEQGGITTLLLSTLGTFLGVNDGHYDPSDQNAALAQLQPALAARPTLVIADNLDSLLPQGEAPLDRETREQLWNVLRELAMLSAGVLLTSRAPIVEEHLAPGTHIAILPLGGLLPTDAYALATHLLENLGISRTRAPYAELRDLLVQLDHHPLAIQLVLPTIREQSLATICTEFATLLLSFVNVQESGHNRSLLTSLDYSLRHLSNTQRAFLPRLIHFEGGASEDDLLAITQIPEIEWTALRQALELAALLIPEPVAGFAIPFLHFHPILLPYLRSQSSAAEDSALHVRWIERYTARARYLFQQDKRHPQAVRTLVQKELSNLCRTLDSLLETGDLEEAAVLANYITHFLNLTGRWRERDNLQRRVGEVLTAQIMDKPDEFFFAEYLQESGLGESEYLSGDFHKAVTHFTRLLARIESLPVGRMPLGPGSYEHCITLIYLAWSLRGSWQLMAAETSAHQALIVIDALLQQRPEDTSYQSLRGSVLSALADILRDQGHYARARQYYEESLAIDQRLGDLSAQAITEGNLGTLAEHEDLAEAQKHHTPA